MSKDQLGWQQILSGDDSAEAPEATRAVEATLAPKADSDSSLDSSASQTMITASEAKRDKPRGKKVSNVSAEIQYAKKNWRKLEFAQPVSAPSVGVQNPPEAAAGEASRSTSELSAEPFAKAASVAIEAPSEPIAEDLAEPQILTVSALNRQIRDQLEGGFSLVWLKGEISNFKAHTSGHFYFSLKDAKAQINAVMFRGFNSQLRFKPEDGMEVLVRGKITVYEPRGNYQIFCETMEPIGAGALQKAFEQLKAKLQAEGLFAPERKRAIPQLPKHIAIVTSPTGAAIRDMLNVLGRRFKAARITVVPCKVQGDQAPAEIVQAIQLANRLPDVDVMIVGRGGGSIEDLWAFNHEGVARAIAASRVPTISAVGHEVDFTIADFVADLRAPTPSAAAELVVKNAADLEERVIGFRRSLRYAILRHLNMARERTRSISKRLVDPQRRIQDASMRCDELLQRLENGVRRLLHNKRLEIELFRNRMGTPLERIAREREIASGLESRLRTGMRNFLRHTRERVELQMAVLDSLSPLRVLDRGFSMVLVGTKIVTRATDVVTGDAIRVRLSEGSLEAQVTRVDKEPK